jgi:hypothetical protein
LIRQCNAYVQSYKTRVSAIKQQVDADNAFVASQSSQPSCGSKIDFLESRFEKTVNTFQKRFFRKRNRYQMSEARAKYIREMNPISGAKNTDHLEIMETQIEKLIHDAKKEVANWVTIEYSMKQKENELAIELEKMKDMLTTMQKRTNNVKTLLEEKNTQVQTMDTTFEKKIQALDATFDTFRKTKSHDYTKRNGWYEANNECTTQVISIEKIIDTK